MRANIFWKRIHPIAEDIEDIGVLCRLKYGKTYISHDLVFKELLRHELIVMKDYGYPELALYVKRH